MWKAQILANKYFELSIWQIFNMTYNKFKAVNVLILNTISNKNLRHTWYHDVAHRLRITGLPYLNSWVGKQGSFSKRAHRLYVSFLPKLYSGNNLHWKRFYCHGKLPRFTTLSESFITSHLFSSTFRELTWTSSTNMIMCFIQKPVWCWRVCLLAVPVGAM
jgi:hypothetical protein